MNWHHETSGISGSTFMLQDDFEGGEVFIVYFLYWKMTHAAVIQQQLFASSRSKLGANKGSMKKTQWPGGNDKES